MTLLISQSVSTQAIHREQERLDNMGVVTLESSCSPHLSLLLFLSLDDISQRSRQWGEGRDGSFSYLSLHVAVGPRSLGNSPAGRGPQGSLSSRLSY
jgi:hypothetical protein